MNQLIRTKIAYNFVTLNEEETEIEIYDIIASKKTEDWWTGEKGSEVTPNDFKEKLNAVETNNITIRMNSAGGEVDAANVIAVAIKDARQAGKHIKCKIDGICASAAVQIAMVCDEVIIHASALMMIHNPSLFLYGRYDEPEMSKSVNMLKAYKDAIINYYEDKTGLSRQKLSNMMDVETYMDGKEAVEKGFADRLMFDDEVKIDDVINRIHSACVNTSFKLPEFYQSAINQNTNIPKEGAIKSMTKEQIKTVQDLVNEFPDLTTQLRNEAITNAKSEGVTSGAESERARIKALDELSGKVSDELLNKAKYETFDTAENVAVEAIKTGAFVNTSVLTGMANETKPAQNVAGLVNEGVNNPIDEKKAAVNKAQEIAAKHFKSIGRKGDE